jgi:hypothetical protein
VADIPTGFSLTPPYESKKRRKKYVVGKKISNKLKNIKKKRRGDLPKHTGAGKNMSRRTVTRSADFTLMTSNMQQL